MEIREHILLKHLTEAAIEQISSEYQENGYEMKKEDKLGNLVADLTARKGDKLIVFEFKSTKWNAAKMDSIRELRNYVVHKFGAQFKLVLVNPPGKVLIEIEDLEQILLNLVVNKPTLYDNLATHTKIDGISDVELKQVRVRRDEIELAGSAVVSLILQDGSDSDIEKDDGLSLSESLFLSFHILFDRNFEVKEVHKLDLDTSEL